MSGSNREQTTYFLQILHLNLSICRKLLNLQSDQNGSHSNSKSYGLCPCEPMVSRPLCICDGWYRIHGESASGKIAQIMPRHKEHLPPHAAEKGPRHQRKAYRTPQCPSEYYSVLGIFFFMFEISCELTSFQLYCSSYSTNSGKNGHTN